MILPDMGMKRSRQKAGLADALFTPVQQRVLGLLFCQPERRFQSAELIRLVKGGTGAVHRQLGRLEAAGLVTTTRTGNQKHYQARRDSPVFNEIRELMLKTTGLTEPIRDALRPMAKRIHTAFVFGSVAKGTDNASSDIDLLIISDSLDHADIFQALEPAEQILGRKINPTVTTLAAWRNKRTRPDSFAVRITAQPRLFVIGTSDGLE